MHANGRCSALVVEDDASIAEFVESVLCDEGYDVRMAHSGEEALRQVAESRPDVVLLDLLLPALGGEAVLSALRERYGHKVPVILMTAAREGVSQRESLEAEGLLLKPFDLADLVREVQRQLATTSCA